MKNKTKSRQYSDLLLVDLLNLDWKNLFSRYRTDILGFFLFSILMLLIIIGTFFLKNIGS
jgi:hypothetical protein